MIRALLKLVEFAEIVRLTELFPEPALFQNLFQNEQQEHECI
jgi:hypothetical protein